MLPLIALLLFAPPTDRCDPTARWTAAERAQTFELVRSTCRALGAADPVCEALVAVTWRESRGVATVLHTLGKNEAGSGPHGIGRFWRRKLRLERDHLCHTPTSTRAVLHIWQRFVRRGARRIVQLQRGYAGRSLSDDSHPYADARWCNLLKTPPKVDGQPLWAPVDCQTRLKLADFGDTLTVEEIR